MGAPHCDTGRGRCAIRTEFLSPAGEAQALSGVSLGKRVVSPFGFLEQEGPMEEHRIASRQRVLKAGTIEFGGGAISCTVRNISAAGASLEVASPVGIPAQFTLVTNGNHLPCRVIWRKEKRIGVAFDQRR
jgi:hypothetical protein